MLLRARGVGYSYRRGLPRILDGVELEVNVGERLAIVGPSGSGKTTLLALLGGWLQPDAGDIGVICDRQEDLPDRHVSWVLQTANALPDHDALHNAAIGALGDGCRPAEARQEAGRALATVGLGDKTGSLVRTLSGGELQRVCIARALASRRPFILADEPTGQLDHRTTQSVLEALLGSGDTRAVVVVTHDPEVAAGCDRVLKLQDQRLWQVSS